MSVAGPDRTGVTLAAGTAALAGATEVVTFLVGFWVMDALFLSGENRLEDILSLVFIVVPVLFGGVMAAGLAAGAALKVPLWGLVVPLATAGGVLAFRLIGNTVGRALVFVAVFAAAGAVAALAGPPDDRDLPVRRKVL